MMNEILESLARVWSLFHEKTVFFIPRLMAALAVVAVGWLLAVVVRAVLKRFLRAIRFDARCERTGFAMLLGKAEIPWPPGETLGHCASWVILLSALIFSLSALGIAVLDQMVSAFFLYLPNLALAGVILVVGFMAANFLSRAALLAAINRELPPARFLAETVRTLTGLLATTMALEQLGIARSTVTATFAIAFGGLVLGLALAFGLGGRHLAREYLERRFHRKPPEGGNELDHL